MQKYFETVTDSLGNAIGEATVTVYLTSGALAALYSDNALTALGNPLTTRNDGSFAFYAADGRYNISITKAGITPITIRDVMIVDALALAGIGDGGAHVIADVTGLQAALDSKEASGAAAAAVSSHQAALDPHSQYLLPADTTDALIEGAANKYFTESRVRASVLTGLSVVTNAAITATDSVLSAFGKVQAQIAAVLASVSTHIADIANPHAVTKAQVGLGNVDNTSDANKPVSTAQAAADAAKQDKTPAVYAVGNISGATSINLANGDVQSATVTGTATITITGWPASPALGQLTLKLTNGGSAAISITNGKYAGGVAPTYTAAGLDVIEIESSNAGTNVDVYLAGKDMK